jgi:hypothetical protein
VAKQVIDESGTEQPTARQVVPVAYDRAAVETASRALLDLVPDAPDDDGSAILGRILDADNWEDLSTQSKLPAGKDLVGRELQVLSIVKRVSELEPEDDGTGLRLDHYLVVESIDTRHGEVIRWQTSAPALVLPLCKLHSWGKLPAVVKIQQSDKPTRRGFRPLNLDIVSVYA